MTEVVLLALRRRANREDLVIVRESALLEELRLQPAEVTSALRSLEDQHVLRVLSPLPFLVLKLTRSWSGESQESTETAPSAYSYSKQLLHKQQLQDSYRRNDPSADDGLLKEMLETLGETDPSSFRKAIENYSPSVIRTALDRVRRAKSIRKNRTALFRHLLPRIARLAQPIS